MNVAPMLRRISLVMAALLMGAAVLTSVIVRASGGAEEWLTGDADCNGNVDSVDASLILQWNARLIAPLPCWRAADATDDYAVDSLDALLVLQQEAALIDSLGVPELRLCPAPFKKATEGDLEETIDLDGDGEEELLTIQLNSVEGTATLGLSVPDAASGLYQVVAQEVFTTLFVASAGPYTLATHTDLTGDGKDEAILCVTAWGANDPFTSMAIFAYQSGSASTLFDAEHIPWAFVSREGLDLVVTNRFDWFAGSCEVITTRVYDWEGARFVLGSEETTKRFRSDDCGELWDGPR